LGAEDITVFFRHLAFRGSNLDAIEKIVVLPFSPDKAPPRSQQVKDFYRVQMPSIPLSGKPHDRMKIHFYLKDPTTTCTVDAVIFIAQSPILATFDSIPYRDLGSEFQGNVSPSELIPTMNYVLAEPQIFSGIAGFDSTKHQVRLISPLRNGLLKEIFYLGETCSNSSQV
jgi:hypothetical protein